MRILFTVTSAKPSYGGPAVSVTSLARAMASRGHATWIWSPDGSAAQGSPSRGEPIGLTGPLRHAVETSGHLDVIHDSGIWMPHNHAIAGLCRDRGIRRIVSPRGMLSPWARRYKGLKKSVAWQFYQRRDLNRAQCLHATSEEERGQLAALDLNPPVKDLPNGLPDEAFFSPGDLTPTPIRRDDPVRTALFLGRIAPVKGLLGLVRAWGRICPPNWALKIVGPDEAGHKAELRQLARRLGVDDRVVFQEAVSGAEKRRLLKESNLFLLPSFSESFGMAVAEALAAGLPVVTTKAAPWSAIEKERLGWWVDPSESEVALALAAATSATDDELAAMGRRGEAYVRREFSWDVLVSKYEALYRDVLSGSGSP